MKNEIIKILNLGLDDGPIGRCVRLQKVLEILLPRVGGNVVEIGGGGGQVSSFIAGVIQQYSRKLLVIDPWELPLAEFPFEYYLETTKEYRECITICHSRSDSVATREAVTEFCPLALGFVDGEQITTDGVLDDINLLAGAEVICVDDIRHTGRPIRTAVEKFLIGRDDYEWILPHDPKNNIETYLVKK